MSLLPESCSKSVTFSNGIKSTEHNAILKLVSLFWTISRASSSATKEISVKIVLGNYVFSLKKKKKKSINCFLQTCLALQLFLHTADSSQNCIQKLHLVGFPPQICESVQFIDEYIQNAGWGGLLSNSAP